MGQWSGRVDFVSFEKKAGLLALTMTGPISNLENTYLRKTHLSLGLTGFPDQYRSECALKCWNENGYTCQMCGAGAGDPDEQNPKQQVRLHIGHIVDRSLGGSDHPSNLRALCSTCNQGAKNLVQEPPSWAWLLSQLRRASVSDQKKALQWLTKKLSK